MEQSDERMTEMKHQMWVKEHFASYSYTLESRRLPDENIYNHCQRCQV